MFGVRCPLVAPFAPSAFGPTRLPPGDLSKGRRLPFADDKLQMDVSLDDLKFCCVQCSWDLLRCVVRIHWANHRSTRLFFLAFRRGLRGTPCGTHDWGLLRAYPLPLLVGPARSVDATPAPLPLTPHGPLPAVGAEPPQPFMALLHTPTHTTHPKTKRSHKPLPHPTLDMNKQFGH